MAWQDTREVFWRTLLTKRQLQEVLNNLAMDGGDVPIKGGGRVIAFPDGDTVARIEWVSKKSEYGDRLYSYELSRNKVTPATASVEVAHV
jgi:hypothetical protein